MLTGKRTKTLIAVTSLCASLAACAPSAHRSMIVSPPDALRLPEDQADATHPALPVDAVATPSVTDVPVSSAEAGFADAASRPAAQPDAAGGQDIAPRDTMPPVLGSDGLPLPWSHADIGKVNLPGNVVYRDGVYALTASGQDVWHDLDFFHFAYAPLDGDGEVVARVLSVDYKDGQWGVMMRNENLLQNDHVPGAMVFYTASGTTHYAKWGDLLMLASGPGGDWGPNPPVQTQVDLPRWLKLVRKGDTITGYESTDGKTWTLLKPASNGHRAEVTLKDHTAKMLVGIFGCPHNANERGTAHFDSVTVTKY